MIKDITGVKVSLIIPNYNGGQYLYACLDSISKLNYPKSELEVIIVDNGSSDGSYLKAMKLFDFVKVISIDRNRGFSAAVNMGIRRAQGDYIGVVNSDVELDPEWLNELKYILESELQAFVAAPKVLFKNLIDGKRLINSCGAIISNRAYASDRFSHIPDGSLDLVREEVFSAPATAILLRRNLLNETGFFDDDYFAYYEDIDLMWRARLLGYKILFNPAAVAFHVHAAVMGEWSHDFTLNVALNRLRTIFKNGWALLVWTSSFEYMAALLLNLIRLIFMGIVGHGSAQLEEIKIRCEVISEFSRSKCSLLKKRHNIRSRRKISDKLVKKWMMKTVLIENK